MDLRAQHQRNRRRRWLAIVVVLVALVWGLNYAMISRPVAAALAADRRTAGIALTAHLRYFLDPTTLSLDLGRVQTADTTDVFRGLVAAANALADGSWGIPGTVSLSRGGDLVYTVDGDNLRQLAHDFPLSRKPAAVLDTLVQALRQPGSSFKPFLYLAAIENGYNASDILIDTPLVVELPNGDVWKPRNYDEKFHGTVSLREALARSLNVPSIKLIQAIGPPSVINVAKRMGIKSPLQNVLSLALGTSEVTLLELTSAYGVLAAEGMRAEPMAITRIEDRNGNVLEEFHEYHEEVLQPDVAYLMTDMLTSVIDEVGGTGVAARQYGLDIPVAGKTGTTDEYTDGWFIGYSPELVIGVWTGFDERKTMGKRMTGANVALPIWVETMKAAYPTNRGPAFTRPPNIVEELICQASGLLSTPYCPKVVREIFIEGNEPTRVCDLHRVSSYDLLDKDKDFRELDREASRDKVVPH